MRMSPQCSLKDIENYAFVLEKTAAKHCCGDVIGGNLQDMQFLPLIYIYL